MGPIVFCPGDSHTKGLLVLLHPVIKGITEIDTELIRKGGLYPLRLILSREFSALMPLQGIAIGNSWLGGISLKDCKNIWKIKMREMKKKIIFGDFNCIMDKINRYGRNKTRTLCRCCSNYVIIVDNGLKDLWRRDKPELTRYDRSFGEAPG